MQKLRLKSNFTRNFAARKPFLNLAVRLLTTRAAGQTAHVGILPVGGLPSNGRKAISMHRHNCLHLYSYYYIPCYALNCALYEMRRALLSVITRQIHLLYKTMVAIASYCPSHRINLESHFINALLRSAHQR
jgi:hypothetical protein